mmetsp:Transcript_9947/g.24195  ORF Transcript_9947/g.24195 Transcript_9947/m.24195 type:complete len:504 (+) Transcript_9947:226-1737(+)|eukprot:CAMPEP_0197175118 /NCGR_PEP_ID=MMETSP1423-20130617/1421_1 /TAXON_ID=476441 /ORGANISM="Pseudo-nitzschia heimii, Strain UNC1101" /LENGTH=503 /DNA_ID=CAMNT_0042624189 /DNA_START=146 /DNA_END=1657 /DNA_ORIENTATION=-
MGQAISLAAVYCVCSAAQSLCQACFGTVAVGTTGRKRSVLLLAMVIASALWFRYYVGPGIAGQTGWMGKITRYVPGARNLVYDAWTSSCLEKEEENENENEGLDTVEECAGNAGVYRPTFLSTLYFLVNAVATRYHPALNREAWPAKYGLFGAGLLATVFVPNGPLFDGFYLWVARIGAAVFVVLQQVILIDVAYNWNDDWVERANESDRLSFGSGSGWLHSIVGVCVALYVASVGCIAHMYRHYTGNADGYENDNEDENDDGGEGCTGNTWVITLTLLGILGVTALQLLGTSEGSLLTSGVISLYAVYLCFTIVGKNPRGACNPRLGRNDAWGIAAGLLLTTVSLAWTGWSYSADSRVSSPDSIVAAKAVPPLEGGAGAGDAADVAAAALDLGVPLVDGQEEDVSGTAVDASSSSSPRRESAALAGVWKLNVVLALVSCYVAMILTGWGTLDSAVDEETRNAANPTVGRCNMAILGVSQWLALGLYAWTLIAPALFPDRDFT